MTPSAALSSAGTVITSGGGLFHVITFDTVLWDTASMTDLATSPTIISAPAAGRYLVTAYGVWAAGRTGLRAIGIERFRAGVFQEGIYARQGQAASAYSQEQPHCAKFQAEQDDTFKLVVYQESSGNVAIGSVSMEVTRFA